MKTENISQHKKDQPPPQKKKHLVANMALWTLWKYSTARKLGEKNFIIYSKI